MAARHVPASCSFLAFRWMLFAMPAAVISASPLISLRAGNTSRELTAPGIVGSDFDRLYIRKRPIPTIGWHTGVLVRVAASSVNPIDWKLVKYSIPGFPITFPATLGFDMSGTVLAVGPGCRLGLLPGDRVWADLGDPNGAFLGGYADHVVADETQLGKVPPGLGLLEAATLPLVAMTTRAALHAAGAPWAPPNSSPPSASRTDRQPARGPVVVVLGGSGGCGYTGVMMARRGYGASVVYATASKENAPFVRSVGADRVFDYHTEDWAQILGDESVDVVYDTVGQKGTADKAMGPLRSGGWFVSIAGALSQSPKPGVQQASIHGWPKNVTVLDEIAQLVQRGALVAKVERAFDLAEVSAAFRESAAGHVVGKVAISVSVGVGAQHAGG